MNVPYGERFLPKRTFALAGKRKNPPTVSNQPNVGGFLKKSDENHMKTVYRNNVPVVEEEAAVVAPAQTVPTKPRRKRFKFSMIGASIGEDVVFEPTGTAVKIASDDQVEFEGRLYKLSPFTGTFLPEAQRYKSEAYCGPAYFSYKGRNLLNLRAEREMLSADEVMKELEEAEESTDEK